MSAPSLFDDGTRYVLSDGSTAVVTDRGRHLLVSRELNGRVVWGQAFQFAPYDERGQRDEDAPERALAALLADMDRDPCAYDRWWREEAS